MVPGQFTLVETPEYVARRAEISHPRLDDALRGVMWALSTHPTAFPLVPGFEDIRVVKTDPIEFGPSMLPRLRIWFRVDGPHVHLEFIEPDPFDEAP